MPEQLPAATVTSGTFNPLDGTLVQGIQLLRLQQSTVANIRDSYHGRYDSFAEAIQNAVDALSKRWWAWEGAGYPAPGGDDEERPQVRVIIDCDAQTIQVIDNGIGMEETVLRESLVPNVSLKHDETTQRGHKGVGTTYLTYGHDLFEIESKTQTGISAYRLVEGLTWVQSDPPDPAPSFEVVQQPSSALTSYASGTSVRMKFGEGSNYGNLKTTFYNSPKLWEVILRSYTAIGLVSLGPNGTQRPWEAEASMSVDLRGVPGGDIKSLRFRFAYPHENLENAEVAELQVLQNSPGRTAKYKLIYLSRDHSALMQLLQPELDKLAHDNPGLQQEIAQALNRGEISVYASLAYKNTLYDELWKKSVGQPSAARLTAINVKGGVLVASVGMPVGETLPHLQLPDVGQILKPEERRRFFLLVHFNHTYRPDIGRKTIPRDQERIIGWLEAAIIRVLRPYSRRLQVTNEDSTHNAANYAQAQEQLQQVQTSLVNRHNGAAKLPLPGLEPPRQAFTETEVISQFASILSRGYLDGYELVALTGSESRYDGLLNVRCDTPAEEGAGPLGVTGISSDMFVNGEFRRTNSGLNSS